MAKTKYRAETYCDKVRELGKRGLCVTDACNEMEISTGTFASWEKKYSEFKAAAKQVRENSARWEAFRYANLLTKTEKHLLSALARIRARRAASIKSRGYSVPKEWQ